MDFRFRRIFMEKVSALSIRIAFEAKNIRIKNARKSSRSADPASPCPKNRTVPVATEATIGRHQYVPRALREGSELSKMPLSHSFLDSFDSDITFNRLAVWV